MFKKIILLIIFSVIVVAITVPLLRSNGLENFSGNEKKFGESAISNAYQALNNPIQRLIIFKIKARQVVSQKSDKYCDIGFAEENRVIGDYSAIVDAYTFFGIRYASANVSCGGGSVINYF